MIVVDTTVLVYAVGREHPLQAPCREVVAAVRDGTLRATTTPEVVQEFAHVRARRRGRQGAVELAEHFALLLRPLMTVEEDDLRHGLTIFGATDGIGAFDAVLAAAALRRGVTGFLSADKGFAAVKDLPYVDPGEGDVVNALAGR